MTDLKMDLCSHKAAKFACLNYHYSKAVPQAKLFRVGVWEDGRFIGCVLFGSGANNNMLKPYGLTQAEGCELVRIALSTHKTPVTKIMSIAIKILKKHNPGLKLIVSYADSRQNHLGIIYQAGNWIYNGIAKTTPEYFYHGKWSHQRTLNNALKMGTITREQMNQLTKRDGGFRHRYLYPLTVELRKSLAVQSKPYPKDMRIEHENNASSFHDEEAGAVPSNPHHKEQQSNA